MKKYLIPTNTFFVVAQVIAMIATFYCLIFSNDYSLFWYSLLGYFCITCLGITVTNHRLLTHRSYKVVKPVEWVFAYFANLGCTGSGVGWTFVHRMHHKYADQTGDPHSPVTLGITGAIIGDYTATFNKWSVKDLINDPVHRFMHEYYVLVILGTGAILYCISPALFVYGLIIPIFLNTVASRMSNWVDHEPKFGNRLYTTKDASHNVWWWSVLTWGEGWHNNHHANPGSYKIGEKWYQFDPGQYVIDLLILLKLAQPAFK
jgi:stearoyl-CoA desaturase (delta-9 desaturase)